jgi:ABC-type transport system involved in cytochrome c biogenesis permease subunit
MGRFWSWGPLETWAFVTWLVLQIFVLAFLTFFGLPFGSIGPDKGIL